ncbi:MAG: hypothetical protein JO257_16205 [Deltaproteobacteria bacterium]|nr:hypothetical protein [Deltaproteobacteria bacterium]
MGSKKRPAPSGTPSVTDINDPKQLQGLSKRLLAYARRYASLRTWWLGKAGALAKGFTVEDVVCKAMVSLFGEVEPAVRDKRGPRRWDSVKYPEPWVYLMVFVKTELRNLSVSSENRRSERDVDDDALITNDTAESLLLEAELDAEHEQRVQRAYLLLVEEIGDDASLQQLHDLMFDGICKPQLLAERLSMSVKDVNNLKKRMSNAAKRALQRLEKEQTDD